MLGTVLSALEWMTRYGFTAILLSAGILTFIARALRAKTTKRIDGVEILPHFGAALFEIEMRNASRDTIYIYRAYFKPGYFADRSEWRKPSTLMFQQWVDDEFPAISGAERRNTAGEYVLAALSPAGTTMRPAFLEPGDSVFYRITLEPGDHGKSSELFKKHRAGRLAIHLVHGTRPQILELQL